MTRKDILFLLLPSAFLLFIAGLAVMSSRAFFVFTHSEQWSQKNFEGFTAKVQSGEVQLTKDQWIRLLRDSKTIEAEVEKGHVSLMRIIASGIVVGVLFQAYVIFRVKAGQQQAVEQTTSVQSMAR